MRLDDLLRHSRIHVDNDAGNDRVGPPVFPARIMSDDDQYNMIERYSAIAENLFADQPEALLKYHECTNTISDHRIVDLVANASLITVL